MPELPEPLPGTPILPDNPYFELIELFGFVGPLAVCKGCGGVTYTLMTQGGENPWLRHWRTCTPLRMKLGLPELPREATDFPADPDAMFRGPV